MSDCCKVETEVIAIDDDDDDNDDDEDVEVVFSNLTETHIHRNLIYHKIQQEIQLLQAMCNKSVPNEFDQFKELAKQLGFQFSEDVIRSAWQRIQKQYFLKLNSHQNNKSSVCLVRPLQYPVAASPPPSHHPALMVTTPSHVVPSSSSPTASGAFPIALLMNQSVEVDNLHHSGTECSTKRPKFSTPETDTDYKIGQTTRYSGDEQEVIMEESRNSQMDHGCVYKKKISGDKKSPEHNKRKTNRSSAFLENRGWLNGGPEESDETQNHFGRDLLNSVLGSVVSEQIKLSARKEMTHKSSEGRKSSSKKVLSVNALQTVEQAVEHTHVGVKAKIVRTKQTSLNSKKRLSDQIKEMSEAELKEFKAEQKILKSKQKREFEMQQLQKVHDRLVDVLIPKYYNSKNQNEKG